MNKRLVSIIAGVLAAVLLLSLVVSVLPSPASAVSSSVLKDQLAQLEDKKDKIDAEIAELESQLSDNLSEMEAVVAQKNLIDQEVSLLHQQITTINDQIAAYGVLIADKQDELVEAEAKLAELNEKNKERIRAMEENGELSYWSVLFEANSFSDLLDRLNMIEEIASSDRRRLDEMSAAAKVVADTKAELENEKAALEQTKAELDATQTSLAGKRAEADKLLSELVAKGIEYEKLMAESEDNQAQLMEQIADKEVEIDRAEYEEWLATSVPPPPPTIPENNTSGGGTAGVGNTVGDATWLVPISYTAFTSPFGYRVHPIGGDWRMHYGVDLSAPTGTPIYATRSGVVCTADYQYGGAGYYVQIDHMDGFKSIYMHMTHFIVSEGEYVSAGQVIGYCGSTGGSTGPHLHFGISYNGSYVNPAEYINI